MRLSFPAALALALTFAVAAVRAQPADGAGIEQPTAAARQAAQAIVERDGHDGKPFAVVDKVGARLYLFDRQGRLAAATPVLLGQAIGDETVPGVGDKPPSQVLPHERTTPAGRFVTEPGRNLDGDKVVWVDYDAGFAIHRLRPGASYAPRIKRMAAGSPAEHRVSLGCVVVPEAFFDGVVWPAFGHGAGVVYVLPETRPVATLFAAPMVALDQGPALR
jgi:hypothetical protein